MERLNGTGYRTAIDSALRLLPSWLADDLRGTDFLCGVDPLYAGLHRSAGTIDGRSYRDTAHVAYACHQPHRPASDRRATVALPTPVEPWVIVHELGHVLDERLAHPTRLDWVAPPEPVTWYAATNRWEAFAEAFTMAHVPGYQTTEWALERLHAYRQRQPDLARFFTPA